MALQQLSMKEKNKSARCNNKIRVIIKLEKITNVRIYSTKTRQKLQMYNYGISYTCEYEICNGVSSSARKQPASPGGRQMAERVESLCRKTVNGKQSAELVNVLFTHKHKHSIAKSTNTSLETQWDEFCSIKLNSVTAERQQQVGVKRCGTSICR